MTIAFDDYRPKRNALAALLDIVYHAKFSKHVPLVMVLLFGVFAVWRTQHYIAAQITTLPVVSWSLAVSLEIAMIAAGALCFISMREAYVRELTAQDAERARFGVGVSFVMLAITTLALLILAGADGHMESGGNLPFVLLMLLVQFMQSCAVLVFINLADMEERDKLRKEYADYKATQAQRAATTCPHCHQPVTPNNRRRHIESCPMAPANNEG